MFDFFSHVRKYVHLAEWSRLACNASWRNETTSVIVNTLKKNGHIFSSSKWGGWGHMKDPASLTDNTQHVIACRAPMIFGTIYEHAFPYMRLNVWMPFFLVCRTIYNWALLWLGGRVNVPIWWNGVRAGICVQMIIWHMRGYLRCHYNLARV